MDIGIVLAFAGGFLCSSGKALSDPINWLILLISMCSTTDTFFVPSDGHDGVAGRKTKFKVVTPTALSAAPAYEAPSGDGQVISHTRNEHLVEGRNNSF